MSTGFTCSVEMKIVAPRARSRDAETLRARDFGGPAAAVRAVAFFVVLPCARMIASATFHSPAIGLRGRSARRGRQSVRTGSAYATGRFRTRERGPAIGEFRGHPETQGGSRESSSPNQWSEHSRSDRCSPPIPEAETGLTNGQATGLELRLPS